MALPDLVLFDRDGTLVVDVPYNGDPARVEPVPGAAESLDRLRRLGIAVGLVTNQSGVARGHISSADVTAVNDRVAELVGPFDVVEVCYHDQGARCGCRKPAPGMLLAALRRCNVDPARCVMVGDIGSDMQAAAAAGVRGILVPTAATRQSEIDAAADVAPDLAAAIDLVTAGGDAAWVGAGAHG